MTNKSLLSRLESAPEIWRIEGERGPEEAAARYRDDIRRKLGNGIPRFSFVLLGLGHDGHCASLFPNDDALAETEQTAVGVATPGMAPFVPRVSLTLPVLNAAYEVVFLVTGFEKAMAVRKAFVHDPSPAVPASLVNPASGNLMVVLDEEAAMGLRKE
jgi:6-phosphogluconolactonase